MGFRGNWGAGELGGCAGDEPSLWFLHGGGAGVRTGGLGGVRGRAVLGPRGGTSEPCSGDGVAGVGVCVDTETVCFTYEFSQNFVCHRISCWGSAPEKPQPRMVTAGGYVGPWCFH